jgi:hypothetical protein
MAVRRFSYGDEVIIPWGLDEVRGTVREVYGRPPKVYVVVQLTPDLTGSVVDEPTTVTVPEEAVRKAAPVA